MTAETLHPDDELSPAERRRRKVRDAIIEAAEQIFNEEGETGLSMRRIAERIDYSPAALYKYFDSKDALIHEIREMFFERMLRRMEQVTSCINEGPLLGEDCMRAYIETGLEHPAHYKLAFGGFDTHDHEVIKSEESYAMAASEHLRGMIIQSIEEGWFRDIDVEQAAASVWSAVHGLTMLATTIPSFPKEGPMGDELELDDVIAFHNELILRGLGTAKMIERLDADRAAND